MIPSYEQLEAARQQGDAPADAVVDRLGDSAWALNGLLRGVLRNGDALPPAVPDFVEELFTREMAMPSFAEPERIARAERWSSEHAFHLSTALFCASLPTAYAAARGARVLAATGRMGSSDLDRRVNETARFVFDVVGPRAFEPEGSAIRGVQKVRLMHAAVRRHLVDRAFIADEVPINQEDMLGTLLTFSVTVVRAVRRLGRAIHPREADDFYHLWRVVGAMLGIREELLPTDFASADATMDRIEERQFRASEHGRALMSLLLARIEAHVKLPGLGFAPRWMIRHLVGDAIADLLGIPRADLPRFARVAPLPSFARSGAEALVMKLAPLVGRPLLETAISVKLRGETPAFAMPSRL